MAAITVVEASEAPEAADLLPARPVDLRRAIRLGLVAGIVGVFAAAIGMVEQFSEREVLEDVSLGTLVLVLIPFVLGYVASASPGQLQGFAPPRPGGRNLVAGLLTGLFAAAVMDLFIVLIVNFDVRETFINITPALAESDEGPRLLLFGRTLGVGLVVVVVVDVAAAMLGAGLHLFDRAKAPIRKALLAAVMTVVSMALLEPFVGQVLRGLREELKIETEPLNDFLYDGETLRIVAAVVVAAAGFATYLFRQRPGHKALRARVAALPPQPLSVQVAVLVAALAVGLPVIWVIPQILGSFLSQTLVTAGIFVLMAVGLNIVVGYAGLLDLGYVAFFAVGAYVTAAITSPHDGFELGWSVWAAVPFVLVAAALAGVMVGAPVLRMRGDYLAIVTLGFGEIARLMFLSDWLSPSFGGAQGLTRVGDINFFGFEVTGPQTMLYALFVLIIVAVYVSLSLQNSRMGRAWMAMREDESVAEAVGVNIVAAKLSAFVVGAILASLGGSLFAAHVGSVFPNSFDIIVSITVLVVVIVGGMASVPGVVLGAVVLVGLPELLREFEDFRYLLYGALLIYMMLSRPEGFIPSRRRAQELHEDDVAQDTWLRREAAVTGAVNGADAEPGGRDGAA